MQQYYRLNEKLLTRLRCVACRIIYFRAYNKRKFLLMHLVCNNIIYRCTHLQYASVQNDMLKVYIAIIRDSDIKFLLPSDTRSAVASLFNQKETQDKTTSKIQGPYTCIRKLPICLCKWK